MLVKSVEAIKTKAEKLNFILFIIIFDFSDKHLCN